MKPFPIVSKDIYLELYAVYGTEYSLGVTSPRAFDAFPTSQPHKDLFNIEGNSSGLRFFKIARPRRHG
jgi:hypothetical protein